jgi:hypothetical protein
VVGDDLQGLLLLHGVVDDRSAAEYDGRSIIYAAVIERPSVNDAVDVRESDTRGNQSEKTQNEGKETSKKETSWGKVKNKNKYYGKI